MVLQKEVTKELIPTILVLLAFLILPFLFIEEEGDYITGRLATTTTIGAGSPFILKGEVEEISCSQCNDGTSKNSCSNTPSMFCNPECELVFDITRCGCSSGYSPNSDSSFCCEDSASCSSDQGCVGSVYYACVENNDGCKEYDPQFSAECGSECNSDLDCQILYGGGSLCNSNTYICSMSLGSHCSNGVKDGDENGVDCGGSCPESCEIAGSGTIIPGSGSNVGGDQNVNVPQIKDSTPYVPVLKSSSGRPKEYILGNLLQKSTKELSVDDKLVFIHKSEVHNIQVLSIRGSSVMLRISSDKVILTIITPGKTKTYDIDGDQIADLRIKLLSVKDGRANVFVERVAEEEEFEIQKSPPRSPNFVFDANNKNIFFITLSSIILGILLTSIVNRKIRR